MVARNLRQTYPNSQELETLHIMGLEDELRLQRQRAQERWDPKERSVRAAAIEAVRESGLAGSALTVGESVPRFTLPDATGRPVSVSDVLTLGPVVISFYRGGWCPYCNLELRALQGRLSDIQELGASLLAI